MKNYDLIIVLATQPDPKTWKFPEQIYDCLDRAKELLYKGNAPYVAVSGDRTVKFDNLHVKQPFRECDIMADYLIEKGIPKSKILIEGDSRDTLSNLYYLKTQILIPRGMRRILFVIAEFRIPRLRFLCERILGGEYTFEFEPIVSADQTSYNEPRTFRLQKAFLRPMKNGDHSWLDGKFYTAWMYKYWAAWNRLHNLRLFK